MWHLAAGWAARSGIDSRGQLLTQWRRGGRGGAAAASQLQQQAQQQ